MRILALALLLPCCALLCAAKPRKARTARHALTEKDAKAIAERETGGIAVQARRVPLNGATGGWEVDLRTPKEAQGWRCVIDNDTQQVWKKTRIPTPERPTRRR